MSDPPRNGIRCPDHPDARLYVVNKIDVAVGIVLRYRICRECGYRVPCEERARARRPVCKKPVPVKKPASR